MAITRIWQAGIETGSIEEFDSYNNIGYRTTPHTGTYSMYASTNGVSRGTANIPATYQARAGCFFHRQSYSRGDIVGLLQFYDSGGTLRAGIRQNNSGIYLYVNGGNTWIGINENPYYHYSIDAKMASSGGWVKIYKGGTLLGQFLGNTGNYQITNVVFGGNQATASTGAVNQDFDDMYVDDTTGEGSAVAPPILRFQPLKPNAVGDYSQWTPTSGSNYQTVDEVPPNTSDYNEATAPGSLDSYGMTTYTLATGEVCNAIIPMAYVSRGNVNERVQIGTRLSGTNELGGDQNPSAGSWKFVRERFLTKPGGGSWSQADIDAVQLLIKSSGSY
jgi:hypothetical protein